MEGFFGLNLPPPHPYLLQVKIKKRFFFLIYLVVNTIKIDCVSDLYTVTGCEEFLTLTHKILTRFMLCLISQGRSVGGSCGARDPPFVSLFLSKQPTIFRGENAMTIMFDRV